MVMSIDFEIPGMKELKVKFGIQEKSAWVLVKSWKVLEIFLEKGYKPCFTFPNLSLAPFIPYFDRSQTWKPNTLFLFHYTNLS